MKKLKLEEYFHIVRDLRPEGALGSMGFFLCAISASGFPKLRTFKCCPGFYSGGTWVCSCYRETGFHRHFKISASLQVFYHFYSLDTTFHIHRFFYVYKFHNKAILEYLREHSCKYFTSSSWVNEITFVQSSQLFFLSPTLSYTYNYDSSAKELLWGF